MPYHAEMRKLFIILIAFVLAGCSFKTTTQDPATAATAANIFMHAMYIEHDAQRALMLSNEQLRASATAENLTQLAALSEQHCGVLKQLEAESFVMAAGGIEVFYVGQCEKRNLYHRVALAGDVKNGYRVSGVWFQDEPYPAHPLRRQFQPSMTVR
jgi:uncharacterized lipoprotein YajG